MKCLPSDLLEGWLRKKMDVNENVDAWENDLLLTLVNLFWCGFSRNVLKNDLLNTFVNPPIIHDKNTQYQTHFDPDSLIFPENIQSPDTLYLDKNTYTKSEYLTAKSVPFRALTWKSLMSHNLTCLIGSKSQQIFFKNFNKIYTE